MNILHTLEYNLWTKTFESQDFVRNFTKYVRYALFKKIDETKNPQD